MLVALLAAWEAVPVAAATAAAGYVPARRYRDRRKLERTRRHIAELESELGYDVPLEQRIERELRLTAPPPTDPEPTLRIQGYCDHCGLFVVVNQGRCAFPLYRTTPADCAKYIYRTTGERKATDDE